MVAPASPRTIRTARRRALVRWHVDGPPTVEKLHDAITVPRGFRREISGGRLRIGSPAGLVDRGLLDLAERLGAELARHSIRLEIYAGRIVVSGSVGLAHWWAAIELTRQLQPAADAHGWANGAGAAVTIPHLREHVNPDAMLVRPDGPTFDDAYCGAAVPLTAEVTSPGNAADDYGRKRRHYGMAGVAIYLIVDLQREEVVLHTRPHDEGYHDAVTVPFGTPLALPPPVGITLDTGSLRAPA
jgi:Uma2 family endonuclease